ncbi:MAG TPA: hypothetical protein VN860_02570 [Candidatus Acidoferrales bacterium]|nr:hypothetical protein [Candidatus Acidoferrales bacterium]
MSARFSVFPQDRSERWILVPGVASTRQIEIRNESDSPVECHLRVDQPASASASPAVLTIQPRHSRTADIIFLANWSPDQENHLEVSLRNAQGERLAIFSHELVAAESSDCAVALDLKEPILIDGVLVGFKLWFSITSRSATPRRFEVDFAPHPSLRFPERKAITLGPGEATAFEVPVEWNRPVRDVQGWNHPRVVEVFVPVSQGRRTAALSWDIVERRLEQYLSADDREAKVVPVEPVIEKRPTFLHKTPGQLKYTELVELKKLEQAVVGVAHVRTPVNPDAGRKNLLQRMPIAPIATTAIALVALALTFFFFLRPPVPHPVTTAVHVTQPELAPPILHARRPTATRVAAGPAAKPVWTTVASGSHSTVAAVDYSKEAAGTAAATAPPKTVALAAQRNPAPLPMDRNTVVALNDVAVAFTSGGRAVSVAWSGSSQASATVELLDFTGKIIASRTVRGDRSTTTVRLPPRYQGSVSVQVIANGYHGERVVQSAYLPRGG